MADPRLVVMLVLKPEANIGDLEALITREEATGLVDSTSMKLVDADFGSVVIYQP